MRINDGCLKTFIGNLGFKGRGILCSIVIFVSLPAIGAQVGMAESTSASDLGRLAYNKVVYSKITGAMMPTPSPTPAPTPARTAIPARGAPAAPSNLIASAVSTSQINLTWISNSNNATGFQVERALSATGPWKQVGTTSAITTSWASAGLSGPTTYYYRVMAYKAGSNSAYSNVASATTLTMLPAGAPSNLTATTGGSTGINLSWTNNAGDPTGFKIERCQGSACSGFKEIATTAANVTSYLNTDLSTSTSYSYRVRAYNNTSESDYSNTATVMTARDTLPPATPADLTAIVVSSRKINLHWKSPADSGGSALAGYNVFQAGVRIASPVTPYYSVTGLTANTQYCYTVTAYDKGGNVSDQSAPACATTKPAPPSDDPPPNDK
jgi:hypothetical protein